MRPIVALPSVSVGQICGFVYPADNRLRVSTRLQCRELVVLAIRDLQEEPLDPLTSALRPDLRRSRYLIQGLDLARHDERSFYCGSMRSVQPLERELLRIALYDPLAEEPQYQFYGPAFVDSRADRELARQTLLHLNRRLARRTLRVATVLPWRPQP